ncbi:HD domain-containing protein, partial [bacterium]
METILLLTIAFSGILIGYFLRNISTRNKIKTIGMPKQEKPAEAQVKKEEPADGNLLERKILLEETITILRELNENLSSYASLYELTDDIAKTTARIFNLNTCSLLLLNPLTDTLEMYSYIGQENAAAKNLSIKLGEEISGVTARYNEIKIINNLEANKRVFNLKLEGLYKNSLASVPLSYKGRVIGVINASDKKTGKSFTDNDSEILKLISSESAIAIQNFRLFLELQENYLKTVITLAKAVDAKDPYTNMHSQNVAKYSVRLAKYLGLSAESIETIHRAGLLHDIGKIAVRDEVLQKPGKLTNEEYEHIKIHPVKGEEIIKSLP